MSKKEPLYPHMPKRREPLFPHVPKAEVGMPEWRYIPTVKYTELDEGMMLVDQAGDRWLIKAIDKTGVPAKWAYSLENPATGQEWRRSFTEVERYLKMEQPPAVAPKVVTETSWNKMPAYQQAELAKSVGLTPRSGTVYWKELTPSERDVLSKAKVPEVAIPTAEPGMPYTEAGFKIIGRSPSGEANLLQTPEGHIIERIATGKQRGWWKVIIGKTEYVGMTPESTIEIAKSRGAIP